MRDIIKTETNQEAISRRQKNGYHIRTLSRFGNDYLVYDPNKNELELNEENVKMLCNRNMGLGADGILEGPLMEEKQMAVRIWNPNGSIAEKERKRCADFCQIFERCRICTEEALYNADRWRRGRNHLPE